MVPGLFSKLRFADISANAEAHTGTPSVSSATEPNPGAMGRVVSTPDAESTVARFVEAFPGAPSFVPLALFGDLPLDVQRDAANQKGGTGAIKGAFKHGKVYLVAGNHRSLSDFEARIFHETLGHAGVRRMLGDDFVGQLNKLFVAMGGVGGLQVVMHRRGMGRDFIEYIEGARAAQGVDRARPTNGSDFSSLRDHDLTR